jgi:RNA polymerase sigma-70 factor (ECF subfamily)
LLTIAINLYRNQQRTAARQPPPAPLDPATDLPDRAADVEETWLRQESDRELSTLLAMLPDDQRAAVVLRHVIGLPPTEIAQILGRPLGTVKSDISRALTRLRALHTTALVTAPSAPVEATA